MSRWILRAALCACAALAGVPAAQAGVVVYEEGDKKVEIGGRIQIQYERVDPDGGEVEDDLFFRRLRPYIAATVTEHWYGKIELDFGKASDGDEVQVKDAYFAYSGWNHKTLTLGNTKTPFSREFLTSSSSQSTVERGFVGDHNFGTPDRNLGVKLEGHNDDKKIAWAVAFGSEALDPDAKKMDFDTPANDQSDWNEGWVLAGRVDFHPWGNLKLSQGDFAREERFRGTFSAGAFTWSNDDDNNSYTDASGSSTSSSKVDLDSAAGVELSAALRGRGISLDTELQQISGDTVDRAFTGGLYRAGTTDLDKVQLKGSYLFPGNRFEVVGRWETLDADNYQTSWDASELGLNVYLNEHKLKAQLSYRMDENVDGRRGVDQDTLYLLWQYAF